MRLGLTINLGNYESLRVDTSECETLSEARAQLKDLVLAYREYIPKRILELVEL